MDDLLGASERALEARVEAFVREQLEPLEQSLSDEERAELSPSTRREVIARARAAGIYDLLQARDQGGGPSAGERVVVVETFARANLRVSRYALGEGPGLLAGADGALRELYLEPLLRGEKRSALAITEPPLDEARTRASREDRTLRLRGRKSYVTGGAEADFFLVHAVLEGEPGGAARRFVVVPREAPGLVIDRRFRSLDGSEHVELSLRDVRVPEDHLVPEPQAGASRAQAGLIEMRLRVAARATGGAAYALRRLGERLREPGPFGALRGDDAALRLRLAEMAIALYAARSVLYRTARVLDRGDDARNQALATKVFCTESAARIVAEALVQSGGRALVEGHPLERLHRELQALLVAEGTSDTLRKSLAKGILEHDFDRF